MQQRITIETLASGQPRPYADSVNRVRVKFEWTGYNTNDQSWKPDPCYSDAHKDRVEKALSGLMVGYIPAKEKNEWWETRLNYLTVVDAGTWEFQTTTPYTD